MNEVDIECTDRWGTTDAEAAGVCLTVGTGYAPSGAFAGRLQMDERAGSTELPLAIGYLDATALSALIVAAATALAEVQAH
jgi:hypothetical protein